MIISTQTKVIRLNQCCKYMLCMQTVICQAHYLDCFLFVYLCINL